MKLFFEISFLLAFLIKRVNSRIPASRGER
jgi:hypothetical protein